MTATSRRAAVLALTVALLAGCTDDGEDAGPAPTTEPTTPTTVIDRSGIALAGVPGATTTTIREVGEARLTGTVQGPGGLVPGATVTIERLVAGRVIRTDVLTGPDGRFLLEGVPGGRYRVRAFLAPTLAQLEPEIRFLRDGEEHTFALEVVEQGGVVVRADVAPEPPLLEQPVNLVVLVLTRTVGADGIVRSLPVSGVTVELGGLGAWTLREEEPTTTTTTFGTSTTFGTTTTTSRSAVSPTARTDAGGRVRFELRCERAGPSGLYLRVPVRAPSAPPGDPAGPTPTTAPTVTMQAFDLGLPACVDPATTTTATTATTAAPPSSAE